MARVQHLFRQPTYRARCPHPCKLQPQRKVPMRGVQQIPTRSNTHAQAANAIAELFCLSVNKLQVFRAFVQFFLGRKICSNSRNLIHGVGLGLLQLLLYTTCVYNVKLAGELMLLICCNFVGKLIVCGASPRCLCICACVCLCVCELMDELAVW